MSDKTVRACPVCGKKYEQNCRHDGERVYTVEMPASRAVGLLDAWITSLLREVEELKAQLYERVKEQNGE